MPKKIQPEIRLNKVRLQPNKDGVAEILFWGDVHYGHPNCEIKRATAMLDWALKNHVYVLLMGDLLEASTRDSVGDGVYHQEMNPQQQMEDMIEILRPLADAGLIIGLLQGNHCARISKSTSIDVSKIMANTLRVPYLGYACWNEIIVGKQKYSIYSSHGSGGAKFKHTKIKNVLDVLAWIDADVVAFGHMHALVAEPVAKQTVDHRTHKVVERKCYAVITGSYLSWDNSYAQVANMPPSKLGSPKCKLRSDSHDFHFTL